MGHSTLILVWCMVLHFIADFILQSREMGKKKSEDLSVLINHLNIQYCVIYFGLGLFAMFSHQHIGVKNVFLFALFNTIIHGVIDWNIWKLYKLSAYYRLRKVVIASGARQDQVEEQIKEKAAGWKFWEDHWFFVTIGFDQLLHVSTLIALAGYLL